MWTDPSNCPMRRRHARGLGSSLPGSAFVLEAVAKNVTLMTLAKLYSASTLTLGVPRAEELGLAVDKVAASSRRKLAAASRPKFS